jgi:hypothetical protein
MQTLAACLTQSGVLPAVFLDSKNLLKMHSEGLRNMEGQKQRWEIFASFQRHDGMPLYTGHFRQLVLSPISIFEPRAPLVTVSAFRQ